MSIARGVSAAVRTCWVVRGPALDTLLTTPTAGATSRGNPRAARGATTVAFTALRVLGRLPGWRNTCLYRAVAECLVLRGLGMPATLRLGIARAAGPVAAHAWVECPGHHSLATRGREADAYVVLASLP